jgi:hypothetical protein
MTNARGWTDRLPSALLQPLSGDPESHPGEAIVVATTDERGRPHFALLSRREVVALDHHRVRLATYDDSRTSENMRRRHFVSLLLIEGGAAWFVKCAVREIARPLPGHEGVCAFEATVEHVKKDAVNPSVEQDAEITSPITYRLRGEAGPPAVEALRRLP